MLFRSGIHAEFAGGLCASKCRLGIEDRSWRTCCWLQDRLTGPGTVTQFVMKGPIRAYLYDSEIHHTGARLNSADFANLAVEAEMALRLGDDGRVAAAFPVIELDHFVFRAVHKTLAELIANNGLNAGIVLPDQAWISSDYLDRPTTLSLHINGRVIVSGNLWPLPGGPAASLDWLSGHLAEFGLPLQPGHISRGRHSAFIQFDPAMTSQCSSTTGQPRDAP